MVLKDYIELDLPMVKKLENHEAANIFILIYGNQVFAPAIISRMMLKLGWSSVRSNLFDNFIRGIVLSLESNTCCCPRCHQQIFDCDPRADHIRKSICNTFENQDRQIAS